MSGNTFGHLFTVTNFGESHGPAIGCVIDGCPPGMALTEADIQHDLDRRRPGTSKFVTQRTFRRSLSGVDQLGVTETTDARPDGGPSDALTHRPQPGFEDRNRLLGSWKLVPDHGVEAPEQRPVENCQVVGPSSSTYPSSVRIRLCHISASASAISTPSPCR